MDLEFIQHCIKEHHVRWTYHVNMRLEERFISRDEIVQAVESYEILEDYPDDRYLPICLLYAETDRSKFHIVVALDYDDHSNNYYYSIPAFFREVE